MLIAHRGNRGTYLTSAIGKWAKESSDSTANTEYCHEHGEL